VSVGRPAASAEAHASILAQQQAIWPRALAAGKEGNPFATLCRHCYGRHAPPRDEICPRKAPPEDVA
jgi:Fe-S-cluster-containing hydrogenase component 2